MHQQLSPHLKDLLSVNQSGFKPGHSTETSLLNTINSWIINLDKGCFNLTLFLDLRKAFDTVGHKILLKKLYYYGIANNDLAWSESYFSNRIQYCSINGHDSEPKPNPAGIPQGSSLGPILFLVYINDLTCTVEHSETNLFTDDTSLTCTDKNNKKRSHTQLDSRKQVIAFQDRMITINIKEAQHPLKREKQVIDKSSIMLKISTKSMHRVRV